MTIERLPQCVWGLVITDVFLCIALPLIVLAHVVQILDALAGTSFLALTESVPEPAVQNGLQAGLGSLSASIFRQLPVSFSLLLPGIGFVYDRFNNPGQHQHGADRTMLYAMLGVGGLALASWIHALPFLGGDPPSATGPMLLPARLIILPAHRSDRWVRVGIQNAPTSARCLDVFCCRVCLDFVDRRV